MGSILCLSVQAVTRATAHGDPQRYPCRSKTALRD